MTATDLKLPLPETDLSRILRKYGVTGAKLFGSYARGEQTRDSDLDIFIECQPGTSLFDIFDLQAELEKQAGVKIDLVTKINPNFAEYIKPDFVDITL
jgi:predicted nucleotidyltransferase